MLTLKGRRAEKADWPANLKSQISNLKLLADNCARQLRGWADSLQNSDIKGQRHLSDLSRKSDEQKRRAEECRKQLLRKLPSHHPLRREAEQRGII